MADFTKTPAVRERVRSLKLSSADYEVGYGKPPKQSQFQPGQSGNPRGRPKDARGLGTIIRKAMDEKVLVRTNGKERKVRRVEAMIYRLQEQALKGDIRALDKLLGYYQQLVPEDRPPSDVTPQLSKSDEEILAEFLETGPRSQSIVTSPDDAI